MEKKEDYILECEGISKACGGTQALSNVQLHVRRQCCQLNNKFLDIDYFRRTCYTFTCLRISNSILYKQHL